MGLYLIASTTSLLGLLEWTSILTFLHWIWVIFQVGIGLSLVIFVHELGHFLVAKACGVQCDKFFIGFDVGGYKISRKWGETEYGIGILPLGGYVKMLGQDDNPAKAAEEMRRARMAAEGQPGEGQSGSEAGEPDYVLNPRSYLAKSVPQRMAIISAGVVMNVIFAWIFAVIAYGMGVKYLPCIVSEVEPGSPAWEANLQVDDQIVQIGKIRKPRFQDLQRDVFLGDMESGVPLVIKRSGVEGLISVTLKPEQKKGLPRIGIVSPRSLTLAKEVPYLPHSPAAKAKPEFKAEDELIAVDGQPIETYGDLTRILAKNPDRPLAVTVRRLVEDSGSKDYQEIDTEVAPNPMKRLGLVMKIGRITGVQADSPAAKEELKEGDFIEQVDGAPVGDPITLPDRLRRKAIAGEKVSLTVRSFDKEDRSEQNQVTIALREPTRLELPMGSSPMSAPALGITYRVLNRVQAVMPGSPAERAEIYPEDEILQAQFIRDPGDESKLARELGKITVKFGEEDPNWPNFIINLQSATPKMKVKLKVRSGKKEREVVLDFYEPGEWFYSDRGWNLEPMQSKRKADTFADAVVLGGRETLDSLTMVYRFLQKLGHQVPIRALGGPVTIAQAAGYSAFEGLPTLLIFLTMLSANLAVINFLPIPVLDGGHMVFLILEGILRRPVSEKVVVAFQTIGFIFIITLMLFVLALDVGLIPRGL